MYAIIRNKNGTFYKTLVFGSFSERHARHDYQFYIVFNEQKDKLIKQYVFDKKSKYLDPQILIVDCTTENWDIDKEQKFGQLNIFNGNLLKKIETSTIFQDELTKCQELDKNYQYNEFQELNNEQDLKNLDFVSRNFHDAYIAKIAYKNECLSVLFTGVWGCSIEFQFSESVSMELCAEDNQDDPCWYNANMYFADGYFCLINDRNKKIDQNGDGYTWFRAKKAKYRVIPDKIVTQ